MVNWPHRRHTQILCKVDVVGFVRILGLVSVPAMELQASLCVGLYLCNDEGRVCTYPSYGY
jgi:hypothetical protein